jgi:uncharacterized membrane protein YdjX (TVP38/TMEM64 family)
MNAFFAKQKKSTIVIILAILVIIVAVGLYLLFQLQSLEQWFTDAQQLKGTIQGYGALGPVVLILIHIVQVVASPIPGQLIGLMSGYIYGPLWGTVYTMIGVMIGSLIAFILARKLGRPFVEKVVHKQTLQKFDNFMNKGTFAFFLVFLLPALPDDALCFIAGLTKMRMGVFLIICFLGRLPGYIVLNLVGSGAVLSLTAMIIMFAAVIIITLPFIIWREKIEKKMLQWLKETK